MRVALFLPRSVLCGIAHIYTLLRHTRVAEIAEASFGIFRRISVKLRRWEGKVHNVRYYVRVLLIYVCVSLYEIEFFFFLLCQLLFKGLERSCGRHFFFYLTTRKTKLSLSSGWW